MKRSGYREQDYAFGQIMLTLRSAIGLTQAGLAEVLGVSRRSIADWESGGKYPKVEHLKAFIALAIQHRAFPAGREAEEIRALWKASRQKVLFDERWLGTLLTPRSTSSSLGVATPLPDHRHQTHVSRYAESDLPSQPTPFIGRAKELTERAVFDHSWHLLSEPERELLSRMAIFRGGCSAEAAERVVGATLPALARLVDKSLLREVKEQSGSNAEQVISGSGDSTLRWWDVQRAVDVQVRNARQGSIQALRSSPDGRQLASAGDHGLSCSGICTAANIFRPCAVTAPTSASTLPASED